MRVIAITCSALIGVFTLSAAATAQQKTAKACQAEWRANKADNQAKHITEKAYVAQCRGDNAAKPAAAKPTATAPSATPAPAAKTTTTTTPKPRATTGTAPATTARATAKTGVNQYTSEAEAKVRCPTGAVVWVNLNSNIYHFSGHHDYGHTKNGAYMCEQDATSGGMRAAKNEKRP